MTAFDTPRDRRVYTGESPRYLLNPTASDSKVSIPAASPDQELLEALVMESLLRGQGFLAHPLGVSHVRILPNGRLAVHLDPPELPRRDNPLDEQMAANLFPSGHRDELYGGVPGLRVIAVQHKAMTIGLAGTSARLTLVSHSGWTRWLERTKNETAAQGAIALWVFPEMTVGERELIQPWTRRLAWIGSGLLRRIGLFHSVGNAYWVKGHTMGDLWKIEMFIHPETDPRHDALAEALTDRLYGLPLRREYRWCTCNHDVGSQRACEVELVHRKDRRAGGILLRCHMSTIGCDWGAKLAEAGARSSWLKRIGLH